MCVILLSSIIDHLWRVWESELLVLKKETVTFRNDLETTQLQNTLPQSASILYCRDVFEQNGFSIPCTYVCIILSYIHIVYSGTSLLRTTWDLHYMSLLKRCPQFRGHFIYITVLHWDTEWCPRYRGFPNSEVCNREVLLYLCLPSLLIIKFSQACTVLYG